MPTRRAISSLAIAVAIASSGCTLTVSERMVLPATRYDFDPFPDDVRRHSVGIEVEPGVTLRGWFLEKAGAERVIVYFYGNGQHTLAAAPDLYALAAELQANVLCVDYRGYGWSDGAPALGPAGADALAIFDHMQSTLNASRLPALVMGWSLGTGYATFIAAHRDTAGLILLAPMTTAEDVARHWNDALPWFADLLFSFELEPSIRELESQPALVISRVSEPLLIVHGTRDRVLPYALGKKLHELATTDQKHLCTLEGADHGLSFSRVAAVRRCITDFLAGG
jgi:hypothetical protein